MNIPEGQVTATIYKVFLALLPVARLQNSLYPSHEKHNLSFRSHVNPTDLAHSPHPCLPCRHRSRHFPAADQGIEAHRGDVDPARVLAVVPQRWFLHLNCPSQRRNSIVCLATRCHRTQTRKLCTAAPHTIWPRAAAITSLELATSHKHALVVRCIALLQSRAVLSLLAYCQYEQSDFPGAAEK
jgi:hypothetical protein